MIHFTSITKECDALLQEKWTDGLTLTFGSSTESHFINRGIIAGSNNSSVNNETLFDLASVTKFFSLITILKLVEKGFLSLHDTVGMHTNNYSNLKDLKIYELMNFSHQLETPTRIDSCRTYSEALSTLQHTFIRNSACCYSDIGILVLSKIIDEILLPYHSSFQHYSETLWKEIGLSNTYWWFTLPNKMINNTQNYDYEYRVNANEFFIIRTPIGQVHDQKAFRLNTCGHAGIFSCSSDICKLLQMLLSGKILSAKTLEILTSSKYDSYSSNNHFGLLCYKKYINPNQSEIPAFCSEKSISMTGYTGTYILVDFENNLFSFIGANRLYKRLTTATTDIQKKIGESSPIPICNTKNYVYRKDVLRDEIMESLMFSKKV